MPFMYLQLRYRRNADGAQREGLYAKVVTDGAVHSAVHSVGTANSRWGGPDMVVKIEGFDGLENITAEELWAELRYRGDDMTARLLRETPTEDLLRIAMERIARGATTGNSE